MPWYTAVPQRPMDRPTSHPRLIPSGLPSRLASRLGILALALLSSACSVRGYALRSVADALAAPGGGLAEEEDPELARDAAAFGLFMMQRIQAEVPDHKQLPVALASGFVQYAYAFVQQEVDVLEDKDLKAAQAKKLRARRLYLRGRDHGLAGLEQRHPGLREALLSGDAVRQGAVLQKVEKADVPLLYWTAAGWALVVSNGKDDPKIYGDLPVVERLAARALALDPDYDSGALHEFYVSLDAAADKADSAKAHLDKAQQLNGGRRLGAQVSYAEGVLVQRQDRAGFQRLLQAVLDVDVYRADPQWKKERLANVIAQQRARWLLSKIDDLFAG